MSIRITRLAQHDISVTKVATAIQLLHLVTFLFFCTDPMNWFFLRQTFPQGTWYSAISLQSIRT